MIVKVVITLKVPINFGKDKHWPREQCLDSYVSHWLEEGYFVGDGYVDLPEGIDYKGYEIELPKKWRV